MISRHPSRWLVSTVLLGVIAVAIPFALFAVDHYLAPLDFDGPLEHYLSFNDEAVSNSIGVLSSIIAAVLGIIITVASIIVQLAATRYTPAITEMFFTDRTNLLVLGLYVVGCVMGFWTAFGVNAGWVPRVSLIAMLTMATVGFAIMAPYFAYVFRLLAPQSVVWRIKQEAISASAGREQYATRSIQWRQERSLETTEQLTDIAINSISQKDKIIATACVDALRDIANSYLERRSELSKAWLEITDTIRTNPDFASMADDSVDELGLTDTWFEFKVLRQYQAIYTEALGDMRDINYVVAINTRMIAEKALETDSEEALMLTVKFFNTYLRATLNNNDVRTAYTILNQYRIMAEAMLRSERGDLCLKVAFYIKYYGHLSYQKRLAFVTETVAYDLGAVCEVAHEIGSDVEGELLKIFLEVDPSTSEGEVQETSLRGVRKAQVKLAAYYLSVGAEDLAKEVWSDMTEESVDRLLSIRDELMAIETKDFWEISDRGGNFDYLEPDRKAMLKTFFRWFRDVSGELRAVSLTTGEIPVTDEDDKPPEADHNA